MNFRIPQGSIKGAFMFIAYASTIQECIKEDLTIKGFTDSHSICRQCKPRTSQEQNTIAILKSSLQDVKALMDAVRLKLNV